MIDPHTLKVLEFDKIISLVVQFTTSESGKQICQKLTPQTNLSVIRERLKEVTEMKELIGIHGPFPLNDLKNINDIIRKAEPEGAFLDPHELLSVFDLLESCRLIKKFFKNKNNIYPIVQSISNKIQILTDITKKISSALNPDGEIIDSASGELKQIRIKINKIRGKIISHLETIIHQHQHAPFLQEKVITLRNERYVIPVRSDSKTRVPGVVHDRSKNQATYFIEPFEMVEGNNELSIFKEEAREEEVKILRKLTTLIRENKADLIKNQNHLGILDSIQAKARFSDKIGGREPVLLDTEEVQLFKARHPILLHQVSLPKPDNYLPSADDHNKVIPIDLLFPSACSVLIISGANMGGKTAALKTFGLLSLMVQTGLHIPVAEESKLTIWENIFADIGDEQNLESSISTFSSHINQLNKILNQANEKSLILLDEFGAGTDPHEGGALALAIIAKLKSKRSKIVVTSHLNLLKAYAVSLPDVMNVSVEFNSTTLKPTFKLLYGIPGNSRAFETAARLGIDSEILSQAKKYIREYDSRTFELIEVLENKIETILSTKKDFERITSSAARYEKVVSELAKTIKKQREIIYAKTEKKVRDLFREADSELKRILKTAALLKSDSYNKAKRKISAIKSDALKKLTHPPKTVNSLGHLKTGDRIVMGEGGKRGEIVDIDYSSDKVEVKLDGLKLKTCISELAKIKGVRVDNNQLLMNGKSHYQFSKASENSETLTSLRIIGLRVDEAIPLIEKSIDNARLYRKKQIRIIHGIGSGRLLQAVHNYLQEQPGIKSFYSAKPLEGGAGITIVEFDS